MNLERKRLPARSMHGERRRFDIAAAIGAIELQLVCIFCSAVLHEWKLTKL